MEAAKAATDRPSLIILRTHIGFGSPNKQDSQKAHGSPLGEDEVRLTKEAYGWDPDAHFLVPEEVREHFRGVTERGREAEEEWNGRLESYRRTTPSSPRSSRSTWIAACPRAGPPTARASAPTTSRWPPARRPAT